MGTWQPPPSAASTPRSAVTAARVAAWSSAWQASRPAPPPWFRWPARLVPRRSTSRPPAGSPRCVPPQPSRFSPAAASTMASYWPSSSLRTRVSRLPRTDSITRSGRSRRSCAARRSELVPTFAPARQIGQLACRGWRRADLRAREWPPAPGPPAVPWAGLSGCARRDRRGRPAALLRFPS